MTNDPVDMETAARALFGNSQVSVSPAEHDMDRAARIRREDRQALIADIYGAIIFGIFVIAIFCCLYLIVFHSQNADMTNWAKSVFSILLSGMVSYFLGRRSR